VGSPGRPSAGSFPGGPTPDLPGAHRPHRGKLATSAQGAGFGRLPAVLVAKVEAVSGIELEPIPVRALPRESAAALPVRSEAKTAAIAAAGGVLAGAATVAAVRAVGAVAGRKRTSGRRLVRRERPANVVASRSFLVDVHLLGR